MSIRLRKRILTFLLACALILALCLPGMAEQMTVYTARDDAKVYDATGAVLGTLPAETALTLTGMKGKICRVERNGLTAYMLKADLKAAADTAEPPAAETDEGQTATAYVAVDGAKVYTSKGKVAGTLSRNTQLTVTGVKGSVCRVTMNGRTAYMKKADLSTRKVTAEQTEQQQESPVTTVKPTPGYVKTDKCKVYDSTGKEIATLRQNAAVNVTAYNDTLVKISVGVIQGFMHKEDISDDPVASGDKDYTTGAHKSNGPVGGSTVAGAKGTAQAMDWWTSGIQKIFARGTIAQITDVETGISWKEKRTGGINHADCQPLTAADTAALKAVYKGSWTWERRAIFVTIDGVNYAASMNGMPHGGQSITDNDFYGHHCIHFTNSRCHYNDKVDSAHQKAIKKAAAATLE